MKSLITGTCVCLLAGVALLSVSAGEPDPPQPGPKKPDMAEMMKQAAKYTQPGEHHKLLDRFIGEWATQTSFFMGSEARPTGEGTAKFTWLMEGRWMQCDVHGTMMGRPLHHFSLMGYDNFKMSYVATFIDDMDTAMRHAEGDVDPKTNALILYGTLDEYLTGEHDKMVKYVWRFDSADKMRLEVHDLAIGENNTKVVEITYTRKGS